jgi:hypothetical protein
MVGLSIAAGCVTETIKQWLSKYFATWTPQAQAVAYQILAMISSTFVVGLGHARSLKIAASCTAGWFPVSKATSASSSPESSQAATAPSGITFST